MAVAQLSPSIIATVSLLIFKDALTTVVLLLSIGYLLIPYLYIKYISKEKELSPYFMNELGNR
jgi:hypothetical protein